MKATTVSRRQMLASFQPLHSAPFLAGADDPVFAAIERHREAVQALAALHEPPDALVPQNLGLTRPHLKF
jgi:hypothetical protein